MATDAFGRLRTSNPYTLFEYYPSKYTDFSYSNYDEDIWHTHLNNNASINLNSSKTIDLICDTSGDYIVRHTKLPMEYQPGKSRLLYLSSVPISRTKTFNENFNIRIGLFNTSNHTSSTPLEGVYLKTNGQIIYFTECYNGIETDISQANWNIDKFDSNGSSGKTITINSLLENLLIVIDQEWLGVGRIRVGFNLDGINYYAHQFIHNNTYPYTTTPRLPLTYSIEANELSSQLILKQICCTCISEGGFTPLGRKNCLSTPISGVNLKTAGNKYVLMAVKLKEQFPTGILKLLNIDSLYPSGNNSQWASIEIQLHNGNVGTLNTTLNFSSYNHSITEYYLGSGGSATNPIVISDGYILNKKFLVNKANVGLNNDVYETQLTRNQVTIFDTLIICGIASSENNAKIATTLEFIESI